MQTVVASRSVQGDLVHGGEKNGWLTHTNEADVGAV